PIISIPMLLILLLSAGLMATAQQDVTVEKSKPVSVNIATTLNPTVEVTEKVGSHININVNANASNDTIITKSDSAVFINKNGFVYSHNGKTIVLDSMPELELAPMPPFPAEVMP